MVNEPPLLLADEPTGNLDDQTSRDIMDIFVDLNQQGKTIVMITHESDIAAYAKRMVIAERWQRCRRGSRQMNLWAAFRVAMQALRKN